MDVQKDDIQTGLDQAFLNMDGAPGEDALRLRFFDRLADSTLFLMLSEEAKGDNLSPELFEIADGRFVLVFDTEDRLAQFADRIVPYAAISGRVLARMLDGEGIGLGLNLDVAPSSTLIPAEAMTWLDTTLGSAPEEVEEHVVAVERPAGLPETVLAALGDKLTAAPGLAQSAFVVSVRYAGGRRGHMLAFVGAAEAAQSALAKAAGEALTFSGIEAGAMDVGFFAPDDPMVQRLSAFGLRFDIPELPKAGNPGPMAPGRDPDSPPKLR